MADLLNQDEINALIDAFKATGGPEIGAKSSEKQVRLYDFARPDKFSKEHLRSMSMIHTKHGTLFATALTAMLRVSARVDLLALDQLTFREYCSSVPDKTLFVEVDLSPLASTAVFEFNPLFVSSCVDLLAGGSFAASSGPSDVTEIDKAVIRPVVELALKQYVDAWASSVAIKPRIITMNTDSSARQVLLASEAVLMCGYEVSVGEGVSMMSICLPAVAIESMLPALAFGRSMNSPTRRPDKADKALMRTFENVEVECSAFLGRTSLPLEEVANLEVGDLIRLPTKSDGLTEFWVENVLAFGGSLGLSGKNLGIRLSKPLARLDVES